MLLRGPWPSGTPSIMIIIIIIQLIIIITNSSSNNDTNDNNDNDTIIFIINIGHENNLRSFLAWTRLVHQGVHDARPWRNRTSRLLTRGLFRPDGVPCVVLWRPEALERQGAYPSGDVAQSDFFGACERVCGSRADTQGALPAIDKPIDWNSEERHLFVWEGGVDTYFRRTIASCSRLVAARLRGSRNQRRATPARQGRGGKVHTRAEAQQARQKGSP